MSGMPSVSVVIPAYNMAWCIERAIKSCQLQSPPVSEIIVADDCSSDDTATVVDALSRRDPRIRHFRKAKNEGHLYAIVFGARHSTADWVVLLDADDELTPGSVELRLNAALAFEKESGVCPQLVYGDLISGLTGQVIAFTRLKGDGYPFVSKELSLCQTSTIMLGKLAIPVLPTARTYNTDDMIALEVSRRFPVLHCGGVVSIYHVHDSPTRMSNDAVKQFRGAVKLVRDYRGEIRRMHGFGLVAIWYIRLLRAYLDCALANLSSRMTPSEPGPWSGLRAMALKAAYRAVSLARRAINHFLRPYFSLNYF